MRRQPPWLECDAVLKLGGGRKGERRRKYRAYLESAVREGLERSPWEDLKEQVVLGGQEFLESLRGWVRGDAHEQRGTKRLAASRVSLAEMIRRVEEVKGEQWEALRDRYGDRGRDLVLSLGRRECGLTLTELAQAIGLEGYKAAATAVRRYEERLQAIQAKRALLKRVRANRK